MSSTSMSAASYIDPRNGKLYPLHEPRWCSDERTPLLVTPGAGISRADIDSRTRSLWRYRAALPVEIKDPISLGTGCTPLVQQGWGDLRPFFKLEWFNPTGSFKDRGSAVMLSFLRQIGVDAILEDSSGNGGSSMAGLGAAGGMRVKILAPASTSPAKIAQVRAYGAEVQLVEGPREELEAEAIRQSSQTFYASHNWQPFFLEGTKSLAYEIWEDLGFRAPDNVIVPVGAGSSLLGCAFGFRELLKAGQIAKLPRLFAAQPLNCSPIDASFKAGVDTPVAREVNKTIAEGTAIKLRCGCARSSARCARAVAAPSRSPRTRSSPRFVVLRGRACSPSPPAPARPRRWRNSPPRVRSRAARLRWPSSPAPG